MTGHGSEQQLTLTPTIRRGYEEGRSIRQLADQHGLSYTTIHRWLMESGVTFRTRGGRRRRMERR